MYYGNCQTIKEYFFSVVLGIICIAISLRLLSLAYKTYQIDQRNKKA